MICDYMISIICVYNSSNHSNHIYSRSRIDAGLHLKITRKRHRFSQIADPLELANGFLKEGNELPVPDPVPDPLELANGFSELPVVSSSEEQPGQEGHAMQTAFF
jgi:hypothetical protein